MEIDPLSRITSHYVPICNVAQTTQSRPRDTESIITHWPYQNKKPCIPYPVAQQPIHMRMHSSLLPQAGCGGGC